MRGETPPFFERRNMGFFEDAIRTALWWVAEPVLFLCDFCYSIVQELFGLSVDQFPWIWEWYGILCLLTGGFIIARIAAVFIKSTYDAETVERLDGMNLFQRLVAIGFIMGLLPFVFKMMSGASSALAVAFPSFVSVDTKPSGILMNLSAVDFKNPSAAVGTIASFADISGETINNTVSGAYQYFPKTSNLLILVVVAVACVYLFAMIAIQIVGRIISLLLKICIAPFALSGIVEEKDNSFSTWTKLCTADFVTAFFQSILLTLVLYAISVIQLSPLATTAFLIGALGAVLNAPAGIASILGSDIGTLSAMQSLQTTAAMGHAIGNGVRTAGHAVGIGAGIAGKAGAGAIYGAGRVLGGKTFNPDNINSLSGERVNGNAGGGNGGNINELSGIYNPSGSFERSDNQALINPAAFVNNRGHVSYANGINTQADTFAGNLGHAARHMSGKKGAAARTITTMASNTYAAAGRMLYGSTTGRNGGIKLSPIRKVDSTAHRMARGAKNTIRTIRDGSGVTNG